ncbi:pilus assembly PilX family protein [Undibacterium sp. RuRC25W]|uniref:pilus assembly PilX family protein n=1 Tax=Undibacterium sp. RuRC25W TaxID=3413047 RepID=UPI003BF37709
MSICSLKKNKYKIRHLPFRRVYSSGFSLVISMVMLVVILLLSVSLAYLSLQSERAARNNRDRQVAMTAAEAALRDAESDIDSQASIGRSLIFDASSNLFFEEECARGDSNTYQGLCLPAGPGKAAVWLTVDIASDGADAASVQFGRFTGQKMAIGRALFPSKLPRYLIEAVPDVEAGQRADDHMKYVFRITAIGFGSDSKTQVVLQSFYRKAAKSI